MSTNFQTSIMKYPVVQLQEMGLLNLGKQESYVFHIAEAIYKGFVSEVWL